MPPRKTAAAPAPAVMVEVVPPDPDAGVTFADHRAASAMMLRALAGLDPAAALERLRALYASLPNGTARRAVLAARLAILRDDLPARLTPLPAPVVPLPEVEKPALKAGAVSTLALDAAARLLMEAGAEDAPPPRAAKAPPPVADLFAALAAADAADEAEVMAGADVPDGEGGPVVEEPVTDLPPTGAVPIAMPSFEVEEEVSPDATPVDPAAADPTADTAPADPVPAKPARAKGKARKPKAVAAAVDGLEAGATADDGPDGDTAQPAAFVPIPPKAMASALSVLAALDEDEPAAPAVAFDLGAAFAALAESDDAPHTAPDVMPAAQPDRLPAHPADDIAASLSALIGEGDDPAVPDMPEQEVSDRLAALKADPDPVVQAKPKRALPTDLSDVSAAFAAWDDDAAE